MAVWDGVEERLPMKERLFGGESSVISMVKRKGDGALGQ